LPLLPRSGARLADAGRDRRAWSRQGGDHRPAVHRRRIRSDAPSHLPEGCHIMNTITLLALGSEPLARGAMFATDRDWDGPPWPFFPIVPILIIALVWFFVGRNRGRLAAR